MIMSMSSMSTPATMSSASTAAAPAAAAAAAPAAPRPRAVAATSTPCVVRWKNVVWSTVKKSPTVDSLEHPLLSTWLSKEEYEKEFGPVLAELEGQTMSDFVDFFFVRDALRPSVLRFAGAAEREDFYDWAVELGCCPSLRGVHEGLSHEEEIEVREREAEAKAAKRRADEEDAQRARDIQRAKAAQRQQGQSQEAAARKRILSRRKALQKLREKLLRAHANNNSYNFDGGGGSGGNGTVAFSPSCSGSAGEAQQLATATTVATTPSTTTATTAVATAATAAPTPTPGTVVAAAAATTTKAMRKMQEKLRKGAKALAQEYAKYREAHPDGALLLVGGDHCDDGDDSCTGIVAELLPAVATAR